MKGTALLLVLIFGAFLAACETAPEPASPAEVTRLVEVTVEATRIVETTVEVEVTRIVEVTLVVEVTPEPTITPTPVPLSELPPAELILGKWEGTHVNTTGDMVPATWEFLPDGSLVIVADSIVFGKFPSFGTYEIQPDGELRVQLDTETEPLSQRFAEFPTEDTLRIVGADEEIKAMLVRADE